MNAAPKSERKTCFVVGPIGGDDSPTRIAADWLLRGIVVPTFSEHFPEFDVVRADTLATPGMIDSQVINMLLDADLVIADMSELNPNAFYEMGIRHLASKPVVHMFTEGTAIPFDVAPYRAIKYSVARYDRLVQAKAHLKSAVEEAIKPNHKIENPVTRARGIQALAAQAPPELQLLFDEMAAMRREIAQLREKDAMQSWVPLLRHRKNLIPAPQPDVTFEVEVSPEIVAWDFAQEVGERWGISAPLTSVRSSGMVFEVPLDRAPDFMELLSNDPRVVRFVPHTLKPA